MRVTDYNSVAEAYDRTRTLAPNILAAWRRSLKPYFARPAASVLDVGAGTGQFASALAQWFDLDVVALEPSDGMRGVAREGHQHPRVRYVAARCEAIPLGRWTVERAWLSAVVHQLQDLDKATGELRRVVAPGGLVLIRGFFRDVPLAFRFAKFPGIERSVAAFPSTTEVVSAFVDAGFQWLSSTDVEEVHAVPASWERRLRDLRTADSLLRPLTDAEFECGVAALRALPSMHSDVSVHRVTLRLLVMGA